MGEITNISASLGSAGTAGVKRVELKRKDIIELLKSMEGLKQQLAPLLK